MELFRGKLLNILPTPNTMQQVVSGNISVQWWNFYKEL
jgi:hypothetical protein